MSNKTLAEHLASARAKRSTEGKRRGLDTYNKSRQLKPCNCGRTDGTHHYRCPVYLRLKKQESRNQPSAE